MDKEKINSYKQELIKEKQILEEEMDSVGTRSDIKPDQWEPKPEEMDTDRSDETEMADAVEAFGENIAVLKRLQERYDNVLQALTAIDNDTYGICMVCKKKIETARLNANSAARTCIKHKEVQ